MEEPPRPKDQQILPRPLFVWLVVVGIVMAAGTLGVIVWADERYGEAVAHTMGLATFSIFHLFFSLETAERGADAVQQRAPREPDADQDRPPCPSSRSSSRRPSARSSGSSTRSS